MTFIQDPHSAIVADVHNKNNTANGEDARWILLRPSNSNLVLTCALAILAIVAVWIVPLSLWLRIVLCCVALLVLIVEVMQIRMLTRGAIGAFYLLLRDAKNDAQSGLHTAATATDELAVPPARLKPQLAIRLRYRNPHLRELKSSDVAEGIICGAPYVSTYFSTIPYVLDSDPSWRRYLPRLIAIWADGIDREQFRQVRVQLKWQL